MSKPITGVIVLDGADNAGKTTLARKIMERVPGTKYLHQGLHKEIFLWHTAALVIMERLAEQHLVIMDRHFFSEFAYGEAYRGGSRYPVSSRSLDRIFRKIGSVYVLCVPSDTEKHLARHKASCEVRREYKKDIAPVVCYYQQLVEGDPNKVGNTFLDQHIQDRNFMKRIDTFRYDMDKHGADLDRVVDNIIEKLLTVKSTNLYHDFTRHPGFKNIAGNLGPQTKYLLVGEAISPQVKNRKIAWPFYWDEKMSAASYLNRALNDARVQDHTLAFTNVTAKHNLGWDLWDIGSLKKTLENHEINIVALGKKAEKFLQTRGYNIHASLPHPQYVRRFSHNENDYVQQLKETLA